VEEHIGKKFSPTIPQLDIGTQKPYCVERWRHASVQKAILQKAKLERSLLDFFLRNIWGEQRGAKNVSDQLGLV
jgi:hypothetical protein